MQDDNFELTPKEQKQVDKFKRDFDTDMMEKMGAEAATAKALHEELVALINLLVVRSNIRNTSKKVFDVGVAPWLGEEHRFIMDEEILSTFLDEHIVRQNEMVETLKGDIDQGTTTELLGLNDQ